MGVGQATFFGGGGLQVAPGGQCVVAISTHVPSGRFSMRLGLPMGPVAVGGGAGGGGWLGGGGGWPGWLGWTVAGGLFDSGDVVATQPLAAVTTKDAARKPRVDRLGFMGSKLLQGPE